MHRTAVEFASELPLSGKGIGTTVRLVTPWLTTPSTCPDRGGLPTLPDPQYPAGPQSDAACFGGLDSRVNLHGSSTSSKQGT